MNRTLQLAIACTVPMVFVSACVSMYDKFVETMDIQVATHRTLAQLGYDPSYPHGFYVADERYFTGKDRRGDGVWLYHFAFPMLSGRITCHYHLLVESGSGIVVGWGFDTQYGSPERTCRIAA